MGRYKKEQKKRNHAKDVKEQSPSIDEASHEHKPAAIELNLPIDKTFKNKKQAAKEKSSKMKNDSEKIDRTAKNKKQAATEILSKANNDPKDTDKAFKNKKQAAKEKSSKLKNDSEKIDRTAKNKKQAATEILSKANNDPKDTEKAFKNKKQAAKEKSSKMKNDSEKIDRTAKNKKQASTEILSKANNGSKETDKAFKNDKQAATEMLSKAINGPKDTDKAFKNKKQTAKEKSSKTNNDSDKIDKSVKNKKQTATEMLSKAINGSEETDKAFKNKKQDTTEKSSKTEIDSKEIKSVAIKNNLKTQKVPQHNTPSNDELSKNKPPKIAKPSKPIEESKKEAQTEEGSPKETGKEQVRRKKCTKRKDKQNKKTESEKGESKQIKKEKDTEKPIELARKYRNCLPPVRYIEAVEFRPNKRKIVVTGFAPFKDKGRSPTWTVICALPDVVEYRGEHFLVQKHLIPMIYDNIDRFLDDLYEQNPMLVIHFGSEIDLINTFRLEKVAYNGSFYRPDARGRRLPEGSATLSDDKKKILASRLSFESIAHEIDLLNLNPCKKHRELVLKAEVSYDIGNNVSGYLYLRSLDRNNDQTIFVNIPVAHTLICKDITLAAVDAIIRECMRQLQDEKPPQDNLTYEGLVYENLFEKQQEILNGIISKLPSMVP